MTDEKLHYFDKKVNIRRVLYVFYAICGMLLVADLIIHRHILHSWENLFGFYAVFGFVACVVLVLIAKQMRTVLMRDENYYDRTGDNVKNGAQHVDD